MFSILIATFFDPAFDESHIGFLLAAAAGAPAMGQSYTVYVEVAGVQILRIVTVSGHVPSKVFR